MELYHHSDLYTVHYQQRLLSLSCLVIFYIIICDKLRLLFLHYCRISRYSYFPYWSFALVCRDSSSAGEFNILLTRQPVLIYLPLMDKLSTDARNSYSFSFHLMMIIRLRVVRQVTEHGRQKARKISRKLNRYTTLDALTVHMSALDDSTFFWDVIIKVLTIYTLTYI